MDSLRTNRPQLSHYIENSSIHIDSICNTLSRGDLNIRPWNVCDVTIPGVEGRM